MTDDLWGPWIEHDGKGCPVPVGTRVFVRLREGHEYASIAGCSSNELVVKPHGCENKKGLSRWIAIGSPVDIVRYRIRKPRGMTVLQEIVANPERELEDVE